MQKRRHESLPGRHHRRHIPIGCLQEIKENNCQLIGCLIFHGPLMQRVFVLPLSGGIIMGWSLTHLSKTGFFTEFRSCFSSSQQKRQRGVWCLFRAVSYKMMPVIFKHPSVQPIKVMINNRYILYICRCHRQMDQKSTNTL